MRYELNLDNKVNVTRTMRGMDLSAWAFLYRSQPPSKETGIWWALNVFRALNYSLHDQTLLLLMIEKAEMHQKMRAGTLKWEEPTIYDDDDNFFPQCTIHNYENTRVLRIEPWEEYRLLLNGRSRDMSKKANHPHQLVNLQHQFSRIFAEQLLKNFS